MKRIILVIPPQEFCEGHLNHLLKSEMTLLINVPLLSFNLSSCNNNNNNKTFCVTRKLLKNPLYYTILIIPTHYKIILRLRQFDRFWLYVGVYLGSHFLLVDSCSECDVGTMPKQRLGPKLHLQSTSQTNQLSFLLALIEICLFQNHDELQCIFDCSC